jgi:hypothetical protein
MTANDQFTVFKIHVCPVQVLHSCRKFDGNNIFEKNKKSAQNGTRLLKLKKEIRSKANTLQQNSIQPTAFVFKREYSDPSDW